MRASFNVLDEPWIPVVTLNGSKELLGIRDTLYRAHELREISSVSPLEEFSVYRFLSVFLMDALRPKRDSNITALLAQGHFDRAKIEEYIALCKNEGISFDLFDEKTPFMQAAYLKEQEEIKLKPVGYLDNAQPTGNNHVHFEHRSNDDYRLTFPDAIPKLLAANVFAINGGRGYPPGISSSFGKNPYMMIINGETLFQSLCFLLLPTQVHGYDGLEYGKWLTVEKPVSPDIPDSSFFRMMIYPVRSMLLFPDDDGLAISSMYYYGGYASHDKGTWIDPNVAYRGDKNQPVIPSLDVEPWRNYTELFCGSGRSEILSRYVKYDLGVEKINITLYGLYSENASCINQRRYAMVIPNGVIEDEACKDNIAAWISEVHRCNTRLKKALRVALKNEEIKKNDDKRTDTKIKETAGIYLSKSEILFWKLIDEIQKTETKDYYRIASEYIDSARQLAINEYDTATSGIQLNGKRFHQVVLGYSVLTENKERNN